MCGTGGNQRGDKVNEVQALAEAVLEAAGAADLGVTVSFDDGTLVRHIYVNGPAGRILGYPDGELVGSAAALPFAAEHSQRMHDLAAQARRGEVGPSTAEAVVVRKDGERIPVEVTCCVVPLSSGEPAAVTFLRDIRQRKQAEAALRRSEQRFRQLIETAPDAIGVHRGGRIVYANPALVALCGRPLDDLVDRELGELVHASDREALLEQLGSGTGHGVQHGPLEYRIVRPDGSIVSVETVSIPLEYDGSPATLGFTRDTTERKLLQAQLAFGDRMASLGTLAAGVAHEINNPLAYAALNLASLGRELARQASPAVSTSVEPLLAALRDGLARVATIVRDLQGLSTPNSIERCPVEVDEVLESALNLAMHAIRGRARIVRCYATVPSIKTDPTRVGQILLNLLLNAAQAFETVNEERNLITLGVFHSNGQSVAVSVADNGPGIEKQHLDRVFDPFFTTKDGGMGLGLAICRAVADSLRGTLAVQSEPGKGTIFTLELPVLSWPD